MDQIISKQTAILAKELGFREKCIYCYCNNGEYSVNEYSDGSGYGVEIDDLVFDYNGMYTDRFSAPSQSSLQKWLREKHNIHVMIGVDDLDWWWQLYDCSANGRLKEYNYITESYAGNKSYEIVLEKALMKSCEIIREMSVAGYRVII